jgi:hypothetical protein
MNGGLMEGLGQAGSGKGRVFVEVPTSSTEAEEAQA